MIRSRMATWMQVVGFLWLITIPLAIAGIFWLFDQEWFTDLLGFLFLLAVIVGFMRLLGAILGAYL